MCVHAVNRRKFSTSKGWGAVTVRWAVAVTVKVKRLLNPHTFVAKNTVTIVKQLMDKPAIFFHQVTSKLLSYSVFISLSCPLKFFALCFTGNIFFPRNNDGTQNNYNTSKANTFSEHTRVDFTLRDGCRNKINYLFQLHFPRFIVFSYSSCQFVVIDKITLYQVRVLSLGIGHPGLWENEQLSVSQFDWLIQLSGHWCDKVAIRHLSGSAHLTRIIKTIKTTTVCLLSNTVTQFVLFLFMVCVYV
jgi:hypothetical protein